MKAVGFFTFTIVALTAHVVTAARRPYYRYPSCNDIIPTAPLQRSCLYLCLNYQGRLQYGNHKDGMPCKLSWVNNRIGRCQDGVCREALYPGPVSCDGKYRGRGYATECTFECPNDYSGQRMAYEDGTPCLTLNGGKPYGGAGICKKGICKEGNDISLLEEKEAHPAELKKCDYKENTSKMVLFSCSYYCNTLGGWFYGYYNSNYSSSCHPLTSDKSRWEEAVSLQGSQTAIYIGPSGRTFDNI
ncbi:uncharacterized protein [Dermacentor andersoni]|uniref:uncharacterized protein isoform X2 n=1 Tax=Dermacentor andersoni TaxID=34620 RepID=UPI003B3A1AC8